jgi:hypothetical protein
MAFTNTRYGVISNKGEPLRFAHPFVTTIPISKRKSIAGLGVRMTDHIKKKLEQIPKPKREPTMLLSDVIGKAGVADIETTKSITFHALGDSGNETSHMPELIAEAMATDYNTSKPGNSPAFFCHLGDIIYYKNTDEGYHSQFYAPYKNYPGKIISVPGNHDGELFKYDGTSTGQTKSLEEFQKNFCQPTPGVPPAAGTIFREMVSQPAVYWVLQGPFVDIIGLYSNVAENPGYISTAEIGDSQKKWLVKTLTAIQKDRAQKGNKKALIIVVHHPPITGGGGHSSSTEMLADIDDACNIAGVMPDAVLAGHAHNYQRFTRYVSFKGKALEIPFVVCGTGGRGITKVAKADKKKNGDHVFEKSFMTYGYLNVTVTEKLLTIIFNQVDDAGKKKPADKVVVNLETNKVK